MTERLGPTILWVSANLAGIGLFLCFAGLSWVEPALARVPGARGDYFVWLSMAAPVLGIFLVANLVALFLTCIVVIEDAQARPLLVVLSTAGLWGWAIWFDALHHAV